MNDSTHFLMDYSADYIGSQPFSAYKPERVYNTEQMLLNSHEARDQI